MVSPALKLGSSLPAAYSWSTTFIKSMILFFKIFYASILQVAKVQKKSSL
jgi:hypothetical protein